jgi:hypothetical protein
MLSRKEAHQRYEEFHCRILHYFRIVSLLRILNYLTRPLSIQHEVYNSPIYVT